MNERRKKLLKTMKKWVFIVKRIFSTLYAKKFIIIIFNSDLKLTYSSADHGFVCLPNINNVGKTQIVNKPGL